MDFILYCLNISREEKTSYNFIQLELYLFESFGSYSKEDCFQEPDVNIRYCGKSINLIDGIQGFQPSEKFHQPHS